MLTQGVARVSTLNEFAQWIALVILLTLVIGAYRLAGLRPGGEETTLLRQTAGPRTGKRIPGALARLHQSTGSPSVVVFVSEGCPACAAVVNRLSTLPEVNLGMSLAIAAGASSSMERRLKALGFGTVLTDVSTDLLDECSVSAVPLTLWLDGEGVVIHKTIGTDESLPSDSKGVR